jgi:hypothetical protein
MKTVKDPEKYWKAIDTLHPKHRMAGMWHEMSKGPDGVYCTDDSPNGWGNYGCQRCQAIIDLDNKGIKIWPRGRKVKA